MANSTSLLDLISTSQAQKEVTANALFDAASPAALFGRRASTSAALTWGYYGGPLFNNGSIVDVANGTVALTASATNYVQASAAGVVSVNTSGFTAGAIPLYTVVTGTSAVTSYTDRRSFLASVAGQPYDLLMFFPGSPTGSQVMGRVVMPRAVTLPSGLTGSYSSAINAATGATTLTLAKNGGSIGSVNFAGGSATATFTFASAVSFVAGDVLTLTNQATADASLAGVSVTLAGTR